MTIHKGNWIEFREQPQTGKTKVFHMYNSEQNSFLGEIKWYGPFRTYAFYTAPDCFFETECLNDITVFLKKLNLERKLEEQKQAQP